VPNHEGNVRTGAKSSLISASTMLRNASPLRSAGIPWTARHSPRVSLLCTALSALIVSLIPGKQDRVNENEEYSVGCPRVFQTAGQLLSVRKGTARTQVRANTDI
jgi:hypothetical protein